MATLTNCDNYNDSVLFCILYHVIRISQIEGGKEIYGSGSFVSCMGKFYLLTCCHNFLRKADGDKLSKLAKEDGDKMSELAKEDDDRVPTLKDGDIERKMKCRCKKAEYLCSTSNFKGTVRLPADIVLMNCDDPVLIYDKVSNSWHS